jgi:acyl-coenzyme A thioesterase PaaI-like protein
MVGDVLTVQAQPVGKGFATMHMSAGARNQKGKLIATATTNCAILSLPDE